jgi:peptidoglycan/xylan/chitin deacetylase (PgdA/CDA1 family)
MSWGLPILTYHSLDTSGSVISTDPKWFETTLRILASEGYRTVDLADWIAGGRPPIERAFALTFDDGLRSVLDSTDSLIRHGFRATVFVVSQRLDSDNAWVGQPRGIPVLPTLSVRDLVRLREAGVSYGAHSRTHMSLDLCGPAGVRHELRGSREDLDTRLGLECPLSAYPYGVAPKRVRVEATRWFSASFGTRPALCRPTDPVDHMPRIDAYDLRTPQRLRWLISGELEFRLRARWAARRLRQAATQHRPGRVVLS